jgi:glycosyltransferase involved in cell wall biosynthesis
MKDLVVNHDLCDLGGANKVAVVTIDELTKRGENVSVATLYKPDLQRLFNQWRIDLSHVNISYSCVPFGLGKSEIFAYYRLYSTILKTFKKHQPDQTIFFDDVVDPKNIIGGKIVLYAHLPFSIRMRYFDKRSSGLQAKLYEKLFKRTPNADLILANSSKTAEYIKAVWNRDAMIVYPPVDTWNFKPALKENAVVMLARFCPYKHIEDGIKAVALSRTRPRLYVMGLKGSSAYFKALKALVKKLGIEKTTTFLVNASPEIVRVRLGRAKIFIHSCRKEPFGISVVEAMAAGCVPIVYQDWGPWIDIIDKGTYGIGFKTLDDLAESIDGVISDQKKFEKMSEIARNRAEYFNEERFRTKIGEILCASKKS